MQAGFFLANIIKVVSKLRKLKSEDDVYDCTMDYLELERAGGPDQWKLEMVSRQAGEGTTSATPLLKKIEETFEQNGVHWFKDRLEREKMTAADGGYSWLDASETGAAIMFYDMRDQRVWLALYCDMIHTSTPAARPRGPGRKNET